MAWQPEIEELGRRDRDQVDLVLTELIAKSVVLDPCRILGEQKTLAGVVRADHRNLRREQHSEQQADG